MLGLPVFIIVLTIIMLTKYLPKRYFPFTILDDAQYYELFFGGILIILFFGYFQSLLTGDNNWMNLSYTMATFFLVWYFLTKFITNTANKDSNGVIRY